MVPDGTRRVGAGDDERSHLLHPHILLCDMYIALGVHVVCMHMRLVFGARMHTCMCLHVYINPSICACEHVTSWLLCSGPVSVQCCGACSCRSPGGDHLTTCFLVHPRPVLPLQTQPAQSPSRSDLTSLFLTCSPHLHCCCLSQPTPQAATTSAYRKRDAPSPSTAPAPASCLVPPAPAYIDSHSSAS